METEFVLVTGDVDYADEFDVKFFAVSPKSIWEKRVAETKAKFDALPKKDQEVNVCFGTNEELTVFGFDDWMRNLTVSNITREKALWLQDAFHYHKVDDPRFAWGVGENYLSIKDIMA